MENRKISLISTDMSHKKEYQDYTADYINGLKTEIDELKNRISSLEKILLPITNIDWKTVRFLDEPETFK
jgi:hypothetical protein